MYYETITFPVIEQHHYGKLSNIEVTCDLLQQLAVQNCSVYENEGMYHGKRVSYITIVIKTNYLWFKEQKKTRESIKAFSPEFGFKTYIIDRVKLNDSKTYVLTTKK